MRGDDLLHGTPRQAWLCEQLGLPVPAYAHVPLVLGPDGERLAKRHGAVTRADLTDLGMGPAGLLSMLAASLDLAEPEEDVDVGVLLERFDPEALPAAPWVFTPPP